DPVIAKPSLRPHREHARVHKPLQMSARTLRRNASRRGELAGWKCPAVRQRTHHYLLRGITERLRYFRKARLHRPIKHSGQASAAIEVPRESNHTRSPRRTFQNSMKRRCLHFCESCTHQPDQRRLPCRTLNASTSSGTTHSARGTWKPRSRSTRRTPQSKVRWSAIS